jgi:hypothetical protein
MKIGSRFNIHLGVELPAREKQYLEIRPYYSMIHGNTKHNGSTEPSKIIR